jgi:hypothetical protein
MSVVEIYISDAVQWFAADCTSSCPVEPYSIIILLFLILA